MAQVRRDADWHDGDRTAFKGLLEKIARRMARRAARQDAIEAADAALAELLPAIAAE